MFSAKYNRRTERSDDLRKHDTQAWSNVDELFLMTDFKCVPFIRTKLNCGRAHAHVCVCVCCGKRGKVNDKYSNLLEKRGEFKTFAPVIRTSCTLKELIWLYSNLFLWKQQTNPTLHNALGYCENNTPVTSQPPVAMAPTQLVFCVTSHSY